MSFPLHGTLPVYPASHLAVTNGTYLIKSGRHVAHQKPWDTDSVVLGTIFLLLMALVVLGTALDVLHELRVAWYRFRYFDQREIEHMSVNLQVLYDNLFSFNSTMVYVLLMKIATFRTPMPGLP